MALPAPATKAAPPLLLLATATLAAALEVAQINMKVIKVVTDATAFIAALACCVVKVYRGSRGVRGVVGRVIVSTASPVRCAQEIQGKGQGREDWDQS